VSLSRLFVLRMLMYLGRLNKLLGSVVISQGGVVPHIMNEVSTPQLKCTWTSITCPSPSSCRTRPRKGRKRVRKCRFWILIFFLPLLYDLYYCCYNIIFSIPSWSGYARLSGVIPRITLYEHRSYCLEGCFSIVCIFAPFGMRDFSVNRYNHR
jgi:hypothetical protein